MMWSIYLIFLKIFKFTPIIDISIQTLIIIFNHT